MQSIKDFWMVLEPRPEDGDLSACWGLPFPTVDYVNSSLKKFIFISFDINLDHI